MFKNKRAALVRGLVLAVFLSLLIFMVPGKALAVEYKSFLIIPNIGGESTDSAHPGWIDVMSWSFGEALPSTTAGGPTGRITMQGLKFTMRTNKASPRLFLACATAERLQEAKLEVCRGDLQGNPRFLSIKLNDVLVSSLETLVNSGSTDLMEKVSLDFGKIEITYTPFVSGAMATNVIGGWDLKSNLGIGSLPSSGSVNPGSGGATMVAAGKTIQPGQAICFIKIGGFTGESTASGHLGWIDVITSGFGETQPTTVISLSTGGSPRPVNLQDFRFTMRTNKASPLLFQACASMVRIPMAILEVYRPGVDTNRPNLRITLSDLVISSFLSLGSTGSYPTEEITLKFTKIKIEYTPGGSPVEFQVQPRV